MKVSEFEFKLTTVSDAKLLQMLSVCRRDGPDIALNLLETEAKKRGMEETEKAVETPVELNDPLIESDFKEPAPIDDAPPHSEWLQEESSATKVPTVAKAMLFVVGFGALLFTAYKLLHRG